MHEVNKPSGFKFVCERTWASLAPTADPKIRHCDACGHAVHDCATKDEARAIAAKGGCVALGPIPTMKTVGGFAESAIDGFPMVGWFVVGSGPRVIEPRKDHSTIGSGSAADHVIDDAAIAAVHLDIRRADIGFTALVHVPGLTMRLNGREVTKVDLVDNDVLVVGGTTLRFKSIV